LRSLVFDFEETRIGSKCGSPALRKMVMNRKTSKIIRKTRLKIPKMLDDLNGAFEGLHPIFEFDGL